MQVSVIIVNYNTFALTCACIRSVITHTSGLEYEIIVVDNASSECAPSLFKAQFPNIRLVSSNENLGFAKGNNLGIRHATGKHILLLNSDTELQNNVIVSCSRYLDEHPNVGVVTTTLVYPNGHIQSTCQRFPNVLYNVLELLRFQKFFPKWGGRLLLGPFFDYKETVSIDWTWGAFFMFPQSVLEKLPKQKLFDDFFMYGEDMWWCWEIKKMGYATVYHPVGKVVHHMGGSSGPKSREMEKNRQLFIRANANLLKRGSIMILEKLLHIGK